MVQLDRPDHSSALCELRLERNGPRRRLHHNALLRAAELPGLSSHRRRDVDPRLHLQHANTVDCAFQQLRKHFEHGGPFRCHHPDPGVCHWHGRHAQVLPEQPGLEFPEWDRLARRRCCADVVHGYHLDNVWLRRCFPSFRGVQQRQRRRATSHCDDLWNRRNCWLGSSAGRRLHGNRHPIRHEQRPRPALGLLSHQGHAAEHGLSHLSHHHHLRVFHGTRVRGYCLPCDVCVRAR